jgi:GNAT superfamily N-acetyltransferase
MLDFEFLCDRKDAIPTVARWYFDEWGSLRGKESVERSAEKLQDYMNRDEIPFILLACEGDDIVGVVQLKFREMAPQFLDKEHWLGGLYVASGYRGKGYGSQIVERLADMAPRYGVTTLHLQTMAPDGGMYARLGWKPIARAMNDQHEVLVMERQLST